jgi:NAD(P)-dependent dehydrogenase (short-subunit alcohol dehydrogenase family)
MEDLMPVAIVTGASRGLGLALATELAGRGWSLVVDARNPDDLAAAAAPLADRTDVVALAGDVAFPPHREALVAAAARLGGLDWLVNNASTLGPESGPNTGLAPLAAYPLEELGRVLAVNLVAPLALAQLALPLLREAAGALLNVTSDAAVEPYPGWGGYGSTKAALEQASAVLAEEEPRVRVWWVDPGDMRTRMHQDAFPGEDISDRPLPRTVVPALVKLVDERPPSGRYRAADLLAARGATDPEPAGTAR